MSRTRASGCGSRNTGAGESLAGPGPFRGAPPAVRLHTRPLDGALPRRFADSCIGPYPANAHQ